MDQSILIEFRTDINQLIHAIDVLEELGLTDKATADSFRKTAAQYKDYTKNLSEADKATQKITVDTKELMKELNKIPQNVVDKKIKEGMDEFGKTIDQVGDKAVKLTTRLRNMKQELSQMEQAGLQNTKRYQQMAVDAGKLEDQIGDTAQRVRHLASDTRALDTALSVATGVAGGFAIAQGAAALFGEENEEIQKTLLKVQAALSILNGLQAVSATLNKSSAASTELMATKQSLYGYFVDQTTKKLIFQRVATAGLITLGLAAVVIGIVYAFKRFHEAMDDGAISMETYRDMQTRITESTVQEKVKLNELLNVARNHNISLENRQKAVKAINEISPKYLGDLTLATIEQGKETAAVNAYIEALNRKAKAQALEEILVEKMKELYEAQNEPLQESLSNFQKFKIIIGGGTTGVVGATGALTEAMDKNNESINEMKEEIAALEQEMFKVNEEILNAGDSIDEFANIVEPAVTKMREAFRELEEIAIMPLPEELEPLVEESFLVIREFFDKVADYESDTRDQALADLQAHFAERIEAYAVYQDGAIASLNTIAAWENTLSNNQQIELDRQLAAKLITEETYDKKVAELRRKQAIADKAMNAFRAALAIPQIYLQSLAAIPPPANLPFAIFMAGLAGLQLTAILAAKIPAFAKGTRSVEGGTPGKDSVLAMLMPGERVETADVNQAYTPILDAIHNKSIPADFLNSLAKMSLPNFSGMLQMMGSGMAVPVMGGIDYDLMAEKLGQKIAELPIAEIHYDSEGFYRSIRNGGNRTTYMNKRYRN